MLDSTYPGQVCSVARALEVIGERWTLLIVRDVMFGIHRFDELVADLGVTRTVLTTRLRRLTEAGILERHRYRTRPDRFEYRLTEKGLGLLPVVATLMWWGDTYYAGPEGPPLRLLHRDCGGALAPNFVCTACGTLPPVTDVEPRPEPWAVQHFPGNRVSRDDSDPADDSTDDRTDDAIGNPSDDQSDPADPTR